MHLHLLDPEGAVETRVLTTPRGLADVSVSEKHVWSFYCIKSFCPLTTLEKTLQKDHICITIISDLYKVYAITAHKSMTD